MLLQLRVLSEASSPCKPGSAGLRCPWDSRNTCFSSLQEEDPPAERVVVLEGVHRGIWLAQVCLCAGNVSLCGQS